MRYESKGFRIVLGWNSDDDDILVIAQTDQAMHTQIFFKAVHKALFCLFVYAHNRYTHIRELWKNLAAHMDFIHGKPWCILGDVNSALNLEDYYVGNSTVDSFMREFKEYVEEIEVSDVNKFGLHFTWNHEHKGDYGLLNKIDRIMANLDFNDVFVGANALFQPYHISDHSATILRIPRRPKFRQKPFKFTNMIVFGDKFRDMKN
nr:hypothetical protein [Tanacetum cinerariifolium]